MPYVMLISVQSHVSCVHLPANGPTPSPWNSCLTFVDLAIAEAARRAPTPLQQPHVRQPFNKVGTRWQPAATRKLLVSQFSCNMSSPWWSIPAQPARHPVQYNSPITALTLAALNRRLLCPADCH